MIYIHIPFCRSFCIYCGFYSETLCSNGRYGGTCPDRFISALCNEIRARKDVLSRGPDTLYIGGGTPSVLPPSVFTTIISCLRSCGAPADFSEFTVEVNPDDIVSMGQGYVESMMEMGVNRVSMGIQSLDDAILKWMNRRHDARTAVEAFRILRRAGMGNISIDLIFGLSQLDGERWNDTISKVLSFEGGPPEHVSAYQLSVEHGSILEELVDSGKYAEAPEDICAQQYEILCRRLAEAGYRHYEISNFAMPGYEAVHNSAYWSGKPYSGFGPGAHSYDTSCNVRSWNPPSLGQYVETFCNPDGIPAGDYVESEILTCEQMDMERIMLALRTASGMPETLLREMSQGDKVDRLLSEGGLVRIPDGNVRIPESRFFISDAIISSLV